MHHRRLSGDVERRFLLVFEDGDELIAEVDRFASEQRIEAAEFTGIGSFAHLELDGGRRRRDVDVRSLDGRLAAAGIDVYVVVRTAERERCAGRMRRGVVRRALKLVFTEGYSGSRARPSSTDTSPSALSERTAS